MASNLCGDTAPQAYEILATQILKKSPPLDSVAERFACSDSHQAVIFLKYDGILPKLHFPRSPYWGSRPHSAANYYSFQSLQPQVLRGWSFSKGSAPAGGCCQFFYCDAEYATALSPVGQHCPFCIFKPRLQPLPRHIWQCCHTSTPKPRLLFHPSHPKCRKSPEGKVAEVSYDVDSVNTWILDTDRVEGLNHDP